jgi:AraC-like DNA-binding protein
MDALADVLKTIRLHSSTYFCSDFSSPWGMAVARGDDGLFHVVVEGECWLKVLGSDDSINLKEGDIVAFPSGGAHSLSDVKDGPTQPSAPLVDRIMSGDNPFRASLQTAEGTTNTAVNGQQSCTLMCGAFRYDTTVKHPFIRDLPCFIHIKAAEHDDLNWLSALTTTLAIEAKTPSPGSSVIVDRLTEVLFVQLMRSFIDSRPGGHDYLAALNDPQIGKSLNVIHAEKIAVWSVERLGEHVGMSRTAFTEKFSNLVGLSPKTYLTNWRMQKAKEQLQTNDLSMITIAEQAGYSSEAAFSKAFKQFFEQTPGRVRRGGLSA